MPKSPHIRGFREFLKPCCCHRCQTNNACRPGAKIRRRLRRRQTPPDRLPSAPAAPCTSVKAAVLFPAAVAPASNAPSAASDWSDSASFWTRNGDTVLAAQPASANTTPTTTTRRMPIADPRRSPQQVRDQEKFKKAGQRDTERSDVRPRPTHRRTSRQTRQKLRLPTSTHRQSRKSTEASRGLGHTQPQPRRSGRA